MGRKRGRKGLYRGIKINIKRGEGGSREEKKGYKEKEKWEKERIKRGERGEKRWEQEREKEG